MLVELEKIKTIFLAHYMLDIRVVRYDPSPRPPCTTLSACLRAHGAVSMTASPGFPQPLASSWACSMEGTARSESGKRYQPRYFLPVQAVTILP